MMANSAFTIGTGGGENIVDQVSSSVTMAPNTIYITDNGASLVTYTLPTVAPLGHYFEIVGRSSGLWTLVYGTGQSIVFANKTTTITTGALTALNPGACIRLRCTTPNTVFTVVSSFSDIGYT